jgi:hypothetical protein
VKLLNKTKVLSFWHVTMQSRSRMERRQQARDLRLNLLADLRNSPFSPPKAVLLLNLPQVNKGVSRDTFTLSIAGHCFCHRLDRILAANSQRTGFQLRLYTSSESFGHPQTGLLQFSNCDYSLGLWSAVYAVRMLLHAIITLLIYRHFVTQQHQPGQSPGTPECIAAL